MSIRGAWYHGAAGGGRFDEAERRELRLFEIICAHFAYLERVVIGEVAFDLATHAVLRSSGAGLPPHKHGRRLARRERQRLEIGNEPIIEIRDMLDGMGIKVVARPMPEGSDIEGAFLFRSDIGPCIMVNGSLSPGEQALAAAHQYCHLLADFDPYLPRVCANGPAAGRDPCEDRARSFALEFLMPGDSLADLLGLKEGQGVGIRELGALAVYFGVPRSAAAEQVGKIGLRAAEWEEKPADKSRGSPMRNAADLPERFVHLAVEARSRGLISNLRAARLLRVTPAEARELVTFFAAGVVPPEE